MGRKKKKSTRCKTSKREHKHINKKLEQKKLKSPATNKYKIPLNHLIDQNGKSSEFIHAKLLKQCKEKKSPNKVALSPGIKMKINKFLFGNSLNQNKKTKKDENDKLIDDDSK